MFDLLRPFSFLSIQHPSRLPVWVNWVLPLLISALSLWALWTLGENVNMFGQQGLLDRLLTLIQTLAGFYIAALAAVSSFNSPHLDRTMPSPPPTMFVKYNGVLQKVELTRRRFLTSMFAYLTALSLLLSLSLLATVVLAPTIKLMWTYLTFVLHWLAAGLFFFFLFQMMCVTFWGLFYLGERMITPD